MRSLLVSAVALALLAWSSGVRLASAQEKIAAPLPADKGAPGAEVPKEAPPPAVPVTASCYGTCHKQVRAVIENEPHVRYCYDVKEEEYVNTCWAHTPILNTLCHGHCDKSCGCEAGEACHQCGHVRTRKVLIKEFVTEDVPTPKCRVECLPGPIPAAHAVGTASSAPADAPATPAATHPVSWETDPWCQHQ